MKRPLLLGLWATALFWPFVHSGGYTDSFALAMTPLLLALAEAWPHWLPRLVSWIVLLYLQLCLAWSRWVTLHQLWQALRYVAHQSITLPLHRWTQISAHNATPLVLVGVLLGWLLFRRCRNYHRALTLLVVGTVVICAAHAIWGLAAEFPLASYLLVGLIILMSTHQREVGGDRTSVSRRTPVNVLATVVLLVPLVIGFELPSHPPVHLGDLLTDFGTGSSVNSAVTGYGSGITQINHSLVPSQAPVFVAHTTTSYYWQGATYNTFNGLSWSNRGSKSVFEHLAGGSDVPIIKPYFEGNQDVLIHVTIADASPQAMTRLFYTGAPLKFSVTSIVHARSSRIDVKGVRAYRLTAFEPLYSSADIANRTYSVAPRSLRKDLEVPDNLSPQVKRLAKRLVTGTSGPFDAAETIKRYLDAHYRYSYKVRPSDQDAVNQFLFVNRQGYCDQFSTAFIMMMRSLGVPARWVVGYAPGTYSKKHHGYLVRQVDAHSWAQIWINGIGWVPFDPTPGFNFPTYSSPALLHKALPTSAVTSPSVARPAPTPPSSLNADAHLRKIPSPRRPKRVPQASTASADEITIAALVIATLGALLWLSRKRAARRSETMRIWVDIQRESRRRLGAHSRSYSPREWGQSWIKRFPHDDGLIRSLVRLLDQSFYSQKPLSPNEETEAKRLWETLRSRARRLHRSGPRTPQEGRR
ncbi:transglutaminase domain-containing protein [Ferrimicrobium sp.]|uniref:transglutaminase family protein n=1 Tax=Ferrimicrobium sp. TaxID=2926050 RepID=UPI00261A70CA|nr:transglutaminase domain-containing protein [Ferrimicrobium sp.]